MSSAAPTSSTSPGTTTIEHPSSLDDTKLRDALQDPIKPGENGQPIPEAESAGETKKPNFLKKLWADIGITPPILMMMIKGSVSPVIAAAIYQSHNVAAVYGNLGYLVIIMTMLTMPILPRYI
jgi:hypothetical protein